MLFKLLNIAITSILLLIMLVGCTQTPAPVPTPAPAPVPTPAPAPVPTQTPEKTWELRAQHYVRENINDPNWVIALKLAQVINIATNGRVNIEIIPRGSNLENPYKAIGQGEYDAGILTTYYLSDARPEMSFDVVPTFFPTSADFHLAWDAGLGEIINNQLYADNARVIGNLSTDNWLILMFKDKSRTSFVEMKELIIGTPYDTVSQLLEEFGSVPMMVPWVEIPTAVEIGVTDGGVISWQTYEDQDGWEIAPYITLLTKLIRTRNTYLIINNDIWSEFPPEIQAAIESTSRDYSVWITQYFANVTAERIERARSNGVTVVNLRPEDTLTGITAWQRSIVPSYLNKAGNPGRQILEFLDPAFLEKDFLAIPPKIGLTQTPPESAGGVGPTQTPSETEEERYQRILDEATDIAKDTFNPFAGEDDLMDSIDDLLDIILD